jgi:hypothetical protein
LQRDARRSEQGGIDFFRDGPNVGMEPEKQEGRMRWNVLTALAFLATANGAVAEAAPPRAAAVFPVELWDTSGEGAKPGQAERLVLATRKLAELLEQTGRYRIVDLAPFAARVEATAPRYNCNGCWRAIAKEAGAEVAVLAVVHKVSTLVSTVNIYVVDLATHSFVEKASGQFRGDDDRAYLRAFTFLVNERLGAHAP